MFHPLSTAVYESSLALSRESTSLLLLIPAIFDLATDFILDKTIDTMANNNSR